VARQYTGQKKRANVWSKINKVTEVTHLRCKCVPEQGAIDMDNINCTQATRREMTDEIVRLEHLYREAGAESAQRNSELEACKVIIDGYRYVIRQALDLKPGIKFTDPELQEAIKKAYHALSYNYEVALAGLRLETKKNELRLQGKLW
jgi:hypothetical protein